MTDVGTPVALDNPDDRSCWLDFTRGRWRGVGGGSVGGETRFFWIVVLRNG